MQDNNTPSLGGWGRLLTWGTAVGLLLLPAVAMRFTNEVDWSALDFVVMGGMLASVCVGIELAFRCSRRPTYRLASAIALLGGFLMLWITLAVGIIGGEAQAANLLFIAQVLLAGFAALVCRLRAAALAWICLVLAVLDLLIATAVPWLGGRPLPPIVLCLFFAALWSSAAWLYRRAARAEWA